MTKEYLIISKADMKNRGWTEVDFVYVIGDAYVDHPSFGPAVIGRMLELYGYKVGMIPQPDWKRKESVMIFGRPRLGFLVCAGNMDTMVNHYTVAKKRRSSDAYSPRIAISENNTEISPIGGIGKRPDRATICYGNLIRQAYKDVPIIIGGIEASLRRMAHYDYWSNQVRRSILLDSGADLLSYGMGEHSIVEIAEALNSGLSVRDITFVRGTVYRTTDPTTVYDGTVLPSFQEIVKDKKAFAKSFQIQYNNTDTVSGKTLIEPYPDKEHENIVEYVVQNPPALPLSTEEMDQVYALPYQRNYHPCYKARGGVSAIDELKFSLVSARGCFGGCNFCALTFHQGRQIQARSQESIMEEAKLLTQDPDFKGYISDVGGPTANFRHPSCQKQLTKGVCSNRQCLFPKPCANLQVSHTDYLQLLRKLRTLPKVKKVFIRSGIRFDYLIYDNDEIFLKELCEYHVSGQLRVAPEHIANQVLKYMGKPEHQVYEEFIKRFTVVNKRLGKKQFVVPYLMSSHPGSTLKEAVALAEYLRDLGYMPEQVQDFYPTPSTISTCMYYTGVDPRTMEPVYIPKSPHEKAMQRALIQYRNPQNYDLVVEALSKAGRTDLIGFDKKCLIRPRNMTRKETKTAEYPKKANGQKKTSISKKRKTIRNVHRKK